MSKTSRSSQKDAILVLENGMAFSGKLCGAAREATDEICFNTSIVGYLEITTDPPYAGQIVVLTCPQLGNCVVSLADTRKRRPEPIRFHSPGHVLLAFRLKINHKPSAILSKAKTWRLRASIRGRLSGTFGKTRFFRR
ncbi:MAG: hypothetical protein LUB61_05995 [Eggerthellaceae bacterium]|nr:hypothetical protein [Eggerthellaceae bacterium]